MDEFYVPQVEVVGAIDASLKAIGTYARPSAHFPANLWQAIMNELSAHADDPGFPLKPQRIVWDLQRVLA